MMASTLPLLFQLIQPPQGAQHPLADLLSLAVVLHQLEVGVPPRAFEAHEHCTTNLREIGRFVKV